MTIRVLKMAEQEKEIEWITPAEAAEIIGVKLRTVQHLCSKGEIACKKWGNAWMVDKASAENFEARPKGWPKKAG
jgi:excisionase family DNA binding protein